MRRLLVSFPVWLLPVYALACSSTDNGTLQLVTGEETDVLTQAPAPATLTVYAIDGSGNVTTLADAGVDATDLDLGDQNEDNSATIEVLGNTSNGQNVVAGASLGLQYGALAGSTLPVFIQRTNEWARLPSPPTDARQFPTLAIISGEFLFIGGGNGGTTAGETIQIYDFAPLAPVSNPTTLPLVPLSMPVIGTVALLIGQGAAAYFDFSQNISGDASPPSTAFSFDDVAGGQVIYDYDNSTQTLDLVFVVGATRTSGTPTQAVLEIVPTDTSNSSYPSGNLHWLSLTQPRLGAAATWLEGEGLVVVGGNLSSTSGNADAGADAGAATGAGAEVFPEGSTGSNFSALAQFPPDLTMGAGAAAYQTSQQFLVAGGITPTGQDPGIRVFDLSCTPGSSTCITPWGSGLPIPLTGASTFVLSNGSTSPFFPYTALVVGNELQSGLTHTYGLSSAGATEIHTKVAHYNAAAIESPVEFGSVLLFGGADEIESFFPPQSPPGSSSN